MSNIVEEKIAKMQALRAKPSTVAGKSAGSNVVPFLAKSLPAPSAPVAADPVTAAQAMDEIEKGTEPENQTDKQKDAAEATQRARDFAAKFESFRDDEDAFYILHEGEALSLTSTHCVDIFRTAAMDAHYKLTKDGLEMLQTMIREDARTKPRRTVYRRIGKDGKAYLIDIGDEGRRCARVDANGVTVSQSTGDAIFSRGKGYGELPALVMPTDAAQAWEFVQPLLQGIPEPDHLPLIAVMVERLRSDTPHPILIFIGQEGSGKSTAAERCVMAIDPFIGKLPSVAHSERGFYSAAQSRHSLTMDNLSTSLKGDLEDSLCRSSYGATIMVPELYTTADSRTLRLYVAWTITGISNNIRQADTLDRSWIIRVEKPTNSYRSPDKLRAEFTSAHARVLGGLLFLLAERMRRAPDIEATQSIQHRMVDFLVTGEAVAQSVGQVAGSFIAAVKQRQVTSAHDWLQYDPFAAALAKVATELVKGTKVPAANIGSWRTWHAQPGYRVLQVKGRGYVAMTAEAIHRTVANATLGLSGKESACIPTSAPAAADALDRIQNQMTRAGWTVRRMRVNGNRNTTWVFGVPP